MTWINFLHIYQPPTLEKELLLRIAEESYQNIVQLLKDNPQHKITLNITACLTEYLNQVGKIDLIQDIKNLAENGQIELVGSAAFHPLLPLIPPKEVERQIKVNEDINKKYFGEIYSPKGFYLPEMAYSKKVAQIIKNLGYEWIILDEISKNGQACENNKIKYTEENGLQVVFRDTKISKTYVPKKIAEILQEKNQKDDIIITATDGELYGHKYIDKNKILDHLLQNEEIKTDTISNWLKNLKEKKEIKIRNSSWESTEEEIKNNTPFGLWNNPKNKIHQALWKLANLSLRLNYKNESDPNHFASRLHMEKGLASCTFWWASGKDFKMFEPPAWSPNEVEKGALELLMSIRSLEKIHYKEKLKAEKIFIRIHKLIWEKHWIRNK